ncbi:MAG: NAD(P)H-hydrate dehydratase, partial [Methylococcaceae bacterium]
MNTLPQNLYRTAQVREIDKLTIQQGGISGFALMSRAGLAVLQTIRQRWTNAQNVAVFCGAGNNAGDGYIVAALALALGLRVQVFSLIAPEKLTSDALTAYQQYRQAGGVVLPFSADSPVVADVLVDALLGSGLNRAVTGDYAEAIAVINAHAAPVLAVDSPSGLDTDTGTIWGHAVQAVCTVTFIALKQGLFTGLAAQYCGEIVFASLDVPAEIIAQVHASARRVTHQALQTRERCAHKGHFGHVLLIGGDSGYSGAVRLAAEAALRVGSGLVSVATRPEHALWLNVQRPELMCHGVSTAQAMQSLIAKASVIVIGMGLGQSDWAKALFEAALDSQKPLVVDADALNLLAQTPINHDQWVLTPHVGEAARLLACTTTDIQNDRFAAVSALQQRYGGVVVLKG